MSVKISNPFLRFGYRWGRSTLEESLRTNVYIRSQKFMDMLLSGNFVPYAFDDRCNQILFLSKDTSTWLFIEITLPKELNLE